MSQSADDPQQESLDFKRIAPILFIIFIDFMGVTILIPILPYYALSFNATPAVIGLLGTAYPLMQFIANPILGGLSDRFGRKPILALAQIGTFSSLLLLGFADALWIVFLARILDGITGANLSTIQSAISDVTTPRTRSQGLGLIGAAFGMGFIIGPAISGLALALSGNNYSAPAFVGAGFAFVSIMLTTFVFRETLPPEKRGKSERQGGLAFGRMAAAIGHPVIGFLFILLFVQQTVFGAFQFMFAPYSLWRLGLNSTGNAIVFAFVGVLLTVVQGGLIGPLTTRFGERRLVIAGVSCVALGLILMVLTPRVVVPWYSQDSLIEELQQNVEPEDSADSEQQLSLLPPDEPNGYIGLITLLFSQIPVALGIGMLSPSINSIITQSVKSTEIGQTLGISAAFNSLGTMLGPLWGGAVFDFISPIAPFLIGGIVLALMAPVAFKRVPQP